MRRFLCLLALCLWPFAALAQEGSPSDDSPATQQQTERDRSYLTGLIEDNLSGAGRTVRVEGFEGALSSRATFTTLSIADDEGAWLTIRDGAISWNRAALLRGRIEIDELSAARIELPRLPSGGEGSGPATEATPFALPDLPVSVRIDKIEAREVALGEALFGEAAVVRAAGSLSLAGGEGKADLAIERVDGQRGSFSLRADYVNKTRVLSLDLLMDEAKGGIVANLIGLPDRPAITLAVSGKGPLDDLTTDLVLSTDGQTRLRGQLRLFEAPMPGAPEESAAVAQFGASLDGDISPLLAQDYRAFFGDRVALMAEGVRKPSGTLSLNRLDLSAKALRLSGAVDIAPSGLPSMANIELNVGLEEGAEVLLPLSGDKTWVRAAQLHLEYDQARGDGWALRGSVNELRRAGLSMLLARLDGSGRVRPGANPSLGGTVVLSASGFEFDTPGLGEAVGPLVSGKTTFSWQEGQPLRFSRLSLIGRDYRAEGNLRVEDPRGGVTVSGALALSDTDIGHLSGLAGRALSGAIRADLSGSYTVLGGAFEADLALEGQDLGLAQPELDRALAGASRIMLAARRDGAGLTIERLEAQSRALDARLSGGLASDSGQIDATAELRDLSVLGPGYRGGVKAVAGLIRQDGQTRLSLDATGQGLGIGQPEADRILAGRTRLSLAASERDGRIRLDDLRLDNPQLTASASGTIEEALRRITLQARLANMAIVAPGFPGPLSLNGTVTDDGRAYRLDLAAQGPGGTRATVTGSVAAGFGTADLDISGRTEAALANAFIEPRSVQGPVDFDLRLNGRPAIGALSGQVVARGAKIVAPNLGLVLEDVDAQARLSGGQAQLAVGGRLGSGGTLELAGPVTLSGTYPANLTLRLNRARVRDPELYDTRVNGTVTVDGPLAGGARIGGALTLSDTELRVPSTGLGGVTPIPDGLEHVGASPQVRQTMARAGLLGGTTDEARRGTARPYPLDVTLTSERGIFVRGRGLDAELGGGLRITGTTADVLPVGQFNLVRGRLDILGKRFTLDQGQIALQGALEPYLLFLASTTQDDTTITIRIEGRANAPEVTFASSPELPQDEVLARLIFGRGISNLSALQAAQLASAVATLAGKGGEGIVSRLRSGFGLDDLDVATDQNGTTQLKVGKYLTDNIYTDVTVGSDGTSEINLNLDVTPNLTAKGSVRSDGNSGLGVFYEKDY